MSLDESEPLDPNMIENALENLIEVPWHAPSNVKAIVTTRNPGNSSAPYDSFNLGLHVGDDEAAVRANRQLLCQATGISHWAWLSQVHSTRVVEASIDDVVEADASYTKAQKLACVVLTADCLPVLLCDEAGTQVSAVHAGWRGLTDGILARALECFSAPRGQIMAYIGPAISQPCYEVDGPVVEAFEQALQKNAPAAGGFGKCFHPNLDKPGHFFLNLAEAAREQLLGLGVSRVYGGDLCTYSDKRFYSYRREAQTGRFATAVWLD